MNHKGRGICLSVHAGPQIPLTGDREKPFGCSLETQVTKLHACKHPFKLF